ncbi:AAA family ATPase [Bifidobacterium simiiventris]|uniref:AAA family ATPase n=1 Tax=Bifidobacterium simiiventris TaxID=2834434 RepID=UPI001C56625B|nr:AAA family ATPase [Bifidobacterium simiiventris]MBW3079633.1 AAA family ATPase [Bifidobacterium simiiventris]
MNHVLNLPSNSYLNFTQNSIDLKKVNFFYGSNGTGKTTLVGLMKSQFAMNYDVRIFSGFNEVVQTNDTLDAISLGEINVQIQNHFDELDREISDLNDDIDEIPGRQNLFEDYINIQQKIQSEEDAIDSFCIESARRIKNMSRPQIANPGYNKNDFREDIEESVILSGKEVSVAEDECNAILMKNIGKVYFPVFIFENFKSEIKDLLSESVSEIVFVEGIGKDTVRRNFAEQGMKIHSRQEGEVCAFCGNIISMKRWEELDQLFDQSIVRLRQKIDRILDEIRTVKHQFEVLSLPQPDSFYSVYREDAKQLYVDSSDYLKTVHIFFDAAEEMLQKKKKNPYLSFAFDVICPNESDDLSNKWNEIIDDNSQYGNDLSDKIQSAKQRLRRHYVAMYCKNEDFESHIAHLGVYKDERKQLADKISRKKNQIEDLRVRRNQLLEQTVNEERAVIYINNAIRSLGVLSFELRLEADSDSRGQYAIYSNNSRRSIRSLSTGELNLVAFLYFAKKLESDLDHVKPRFIIFDDPMNSNDSESQYIMYSYISHLYYGNNHIMGNDDLLAVLTHNLHFYLNCCPYNYKRERMRNVSCFRIKKNNSCTFIESIESMGELKIGYKTLWDDYVYSYDHDRPEMMCNVLRKIIDSFNDFSGEKHLSGIMYENMPNDVTPVVLGELKKVLDVNSHGLYDLAIDYSVFNRDVINNFARWYFDTMGYIKHYNKMVEGTSCAS